MWKVSTNNNTTSNDNCSSCRNKNKSFIDDIKFAEYYYMPQIFYVQNYVNLRLEYEKQIEMGMQQKRSTLAIEGVRYWHSLVGAQ